MKLSKKITQGIIAGGLITTGGLFIAKLIGLAYTIPFSQILSSDAYMGIYGSAYRIYSYLLQVFTAGFPFAIATITAGYATKEEWGKVRAVQRLSTIILTILGSIGMIMMWVLAPILAPHMTTPEYVTEMMVVLILLGFALFIIPVLSSYRGYLEGLKQFDCYSKSQIYEQVYRVGFLLGMACLIVYILEQNRVWALYASVLSTSVSGIATTIYLSKFVKERNRTLPIQKTYDKLLTKEIIMLALPYMAVAVLGYMDDIICSTEVPDVLMKCGRYANDEIEVILSAMNYAGTKLVAIPLILAPGFTASIIPHITEAITRKDSKAVKDNIEKTVSIVSLLVIPICIFIIIFAKPIYSLLFYTEDIGLSSYIVQLLVCEALFSTLSPVMTNMMMVCNERKRAIKTNIISAIYRVIGTWGMMYFMGIEGYVLISITSHIFLIGYYLMTLKKLYKVEVKRIFTTIAYSLITAMLMGWVCLKFPVSGTGFRLLIWIGTAGIVYVSGYAILQGIPYLIKRKRGR